MLKQIVKVDSVMHSLHRLVVIGSIVGCAWPAYGEPTEGDRATHESDHQEDVLELPEVHVHGLPLNKDQQLGPVPKSTPWPGIPPALDGKVIDDWMKARMLVTKEAKVTVVVLEPAKHRELTQAGIAALNKWTFDPQMQGEDPVDGELTVRIHFRTQ
jgi:Gram-negative bacterial TonB protein C-terminal